MITRKTISENIKRLRTKLGLTQDDLAKKRIIFNVYKGRKRNN